MDKLTAPVTVKFSPEDAEDLRALAEARSMEVSEYIRYLVVTDRERARQKWASLNRIFGDKAASGKDYRD